MIHDIRYKSRNIKGAYLYVPDSYDKPLPLVIWLTGGNDGAQLPLRFSLGKLLNEKKLQPNCAVLMPATSYGRNYTTMPIGELSALVMDCCMHYNIDADNISICGWSLGADAAAILAYAGPELFSKVCIISNYPAAWNGTEPVKNYLMLVGANEKSASRDWGIYPVIRVKGYNHNIGDKIWTDKSFGPGLIEWLTTKTEATNNDGATI